MTPKSVFRRSAAIAVAAAAAAALTACGAGQVSQTANQVAAVDGAQNAAESTPHGVAIRDAHVLVNPEKAMAALKFSASNEERAAESVYTIEKVDVEGIGNVELKKVSATDSYTKAAKGDKSVPRSCQIVADSEETIKEISKTAKDNGACIAYYSTNLNAGSLVGDKASAAGQNRKTTFTVKDQTGKTEKIELNTTISADIVKAGQHERNDEGLVEQKK